MTFAEEIKKYQNIPRRDHGDIAESGEGSAIPQETRPQAKGEKHQQQGSKTFMKLILLVYRLLRLVLTVAVQIDASSLRFKISRELNVLKKSVTRLLDDEKRRGETEVVEDPREDARTAKEELFEHQRKFEEEHERAKAELGSSQQKYDAAKDALEAWKRTDQGSLAKAACEAVTLTTGRVVVGGKAKGVAFPGMVHLSLVDFDIREAISTIGFGSTKEVVPTSQLMEVGI